MSSTVNESSEKDTSRTRSSALIAKMPIPDLQECVSMLGHYSLDLAELMSPETEIPGESNRLKPELCGEALSVHMNVRWLVRLMTKKIEPIGSVS